MMNLIKLILFVSWASSAFATADECDARLTSDIVTVTERALGRMQVEIERVREMVNSPVPLNPLHGKVPLPEVANLNRYYESVITRPKMVKEWPQVREKLKEMLDRASGNMEHAQAMEDLTAEVVAGGPQFQIPIPFVNWALGPIYYKTQDGVTYLLRHNSRGEAHITEFFSGRVVWSGAIAEDFKFEELPTGEAYFRAVIPNTGGPREVISINLRSGASSKVKAPKEQIWTRFDGETRLLGPDASFVALSLPGERNAREQTRILNLIVCKLDGNLNPEPVHEKPMVFNSSTIRDAQQPVLLRLKDGTFAAAGRELYPNWSVVRYYAPFAKEPGEPIFLKTGDVDVKFIKMHEMNGRIFVMAIGNGKVQVFEPAVSLEPIFRWYTSAGTMGYFYSRHHRVYVLTTLGDRVQFFEPLANQTVFAEIEIDRTMGVGGIYEDPKGVPYLIGIPAGPEWTAYSTFIRTVPVGEK